VLPLGIDLLHGHLVLPLMAARLVVSGYLTQEGFPYTSRAWGLVLDTIRPLDIVLANGTKVRAKQESNQDLYWACRGACDRSGMAVSFQLKTEPAPPVITNWDYNFSKTITDSVKATDVIFAALNFACTNSQSGSFGIHIGPRRFHITGQYYGSREEFQSAASPPGCCPERFMSANSHTRCNRSSNIYRNRTEPTL